MSRKARTLSLSNSFKEGMSPSERVSSGTFAKDDMINTLDDLAENTGRHGFFLDW